MIKIVTATLTLQGTPDQIDAAVARIENMDECAGLDVISTEEAAEPTETVDCDCCGQTIMAAEIHTSKDGLSVICEDCANDEK